MKAFLFALVFVAVNGLAMYQVSAHSGGTDANGCHAGKQPYHCH